MQRSILIIDDHDRLSSSMRDAFEASGHIVKVVDSRDEAIADEGIDLFDIVITDLADCSAAESLAKVNESATCLPTPIDGPDEPHVRAFKFCASHFHRNEFDEAELAQLVETVLRLKSRYSDDADVVSYLHEKIEFELPSAIMPMHSILDYLMARVEKQGVVRPDRSNLFVALDEAFVNAVKHGNKFNAQKLVRITAEISNREASFTVEDEGEGFDVNSIPDPLDPENLFKTSGRGVLFIYNIMDEVKYNDRGNRLTMVKRSDPENREQNGS
ncbi:MAG TPA: ATP-binding protein [Pyrinomonadaceae bacterium]|nr:ATP-binding protein [Pyrinomonadaceae bacterium]